jgi:hypothetical protein
MAPSRRFLLALPLGLPLAAALYFGAIWLQLGVPTRSSQWAFEINQRKAELARKTTPPALFLVGGSATLFGHNAAVIEHETGVPTVNLGTHAALGPGYILHLARQLSRPGDTVLLCIEYELLDWSGTTKNAWSDPLLLDYLIARDPGYFRALPLKDQLEIALALPFIRLKHGVEGFWNPPKHDRLELVYDVRRLDDHGDQTGNKDAIRIVNSRHILQPITPMVRGFSAHPSGMDEVRDFVQWAANHGVRVLAVLPPLAENAAYQKPTAIEVEARVQKFYQDLGVPLLGIQADWLYPDSQFYDTNYHLTEEAAQRHSKRLAARLRTWLAADDPHPKTSSQP